MPETIRSFLDQIAFLLASGQKQHALDIARKGMMQFPASDEICNLAGVCAANTGKADRAEHYWLRAVKLNPNGAQAYYNLGLLNEKGSRLVEAEKYYRQSIAIDPANSGAFSNLGNLLAGSKRHDEAEQCYRKALALDPDNAAAHSNLGVLLTNDKRIAEAEFFYRKAIELNPGDSFAHANLGVLLASGPHQNEAEQSYRKAISLDPNGAKAFSNLGVLLFRQKRYDEAEHCYRRAIVLDSGSAEAYTNLGLVLEALRHEQESEQCHRAALALNPNKVEVHTNLAILLTKLGREDEAADQYRQALALDPDSAVTYLSLGVLLTDRWQEKEAEQCFRRAIALNAGYALAHFNLAFLLLKQGRFDEAWPHFEARYDPVLSNQSTFPYPLKVPFPQWQGESLIGKSILVWPEQGFGDEIQFCRYLPLLKQRGAAQITLVCKPPLKTLFDTLEGVDAVIPADVASAGIETHDYWTYLLSIPLHLPIERTGIPVQLPYLHAVPEQLKRWSAQIPQGGFRVGLVWKGNSYHHNDAHRSLPGLVTLAPLWSVPGVRFISLQKGMGEDEALNPPSGQPLTHLGATLADFSDTAAVIEQLDLVICVDTAVAHLTGALAKPCWVLLSAHRSDWRWLHGSDDTPWYPGVVRLFRQVRSSDWASVIMEVKNALIAYNAGP